MSSLATAGSNRSAAGAAHRYRPEIDGLRAFAVLPVVLFHFGYRWIPGGFLGVDVFFVISGYLITQILARELAAGEFSFREFWIRRVLRIFPALLAMIAVTLAVAWWCTPRTDHPATGKQAVAALLSVANMWFWKHASNYWGQAAEESPLLHTWSLSVEEQFYLVLPGLLFVIARFGFGMVRLAVAALAITSFGLFLFFANRFGIESVFYLLPTRAWELGIGCCLALIPWREPSHDRQPPSAVGLLTAIVALAGLAAIVTGCLLPPGRSRAMLCGTLGAAAVLAFGRSGPAHAILVQPPLVAIGKASYSLYLWHWPVLVFSGFVGVEGRHVILAVAIAVVTVASYLAIEKPTRRNRAMLPFIAAGYAGVLAAAAALALSSGAYDITRFAPVTTHAAFYDLSKGRPGTEQPSPGLEPPSWTVSDDAYETGGIILGTSDVPDVVVFGDSHGLMWCETIRGISEKLGATTSFFCATATPPFPGAQLIDPTAFTPDQHRRFDNAKKAAVARWKPAVVVLCARWSIYREDQAADFVAYLAAHAGHVLLVEQPPENEADRRSVAQWLCFRKVNPELGRRYYLSQDNAEGHNHGRALVQRLAKRHSNCSVVPLADIFLDGNLVFVLDGREVLYLDGDHLSDQGAPYGAPRIEAALADRLQAR